MDSKKLPGPARGGVIVTMLTKVLITRGMQKSKATGSCVYTKAKAVESNSLLGVQTVFDYNQFVDLSFLMSHNQLAAD